MTNLVIPSEESDQFATRFFQKETCQKLLLVAVVGCAILSLVPPLRIGAAIAMRSIALISSLASFHDMDSNNRLAIIAQNIGRCAIIILGIAGLATLSPFLIMISLVMDVSMQAFLCIKALYDGDYYAAALHFGMFVINTLAVSALVTGSWQVMVAAGAVSIVAMASIALGIAFYGNGRVEDVIDVTCYLALTLIGSFALTQMLPAAEGRAHYKLQRFFNLTEDNFYDKHGNKLATFSPSNKVSIVVGTEQLEDRGIVATFPIVAPGPDAYEVINIEVPLSDTYDGGLIRAHYTYWSGSWDRWVSPSGISEVVVAPKVLDSIPFLAQSSLVDARSHKT